MRPWRRLTGLPYGSLPGADIGVRLLEQTAGSAGPIETVPTQYDLYFEGKQIGGVSAIGAGKDRWVVGRTLSYPYMGRHQEFVVEKLTPEGGRVRAELGIIKGARTPKTGGG